MKMAGIGAGRRVFVLGWAAAMLLGLGRWAGSAEFQVVDKFSVNGSALFKSSTTWQGVSAPPLPPSGSGALYFDSGSGTFKISEGGSAYVGLFGGHWSRSSGLVYPAMITDGLAVGRSDLSGASLLVSTNSTAVPALFIKSSDGSVGLGTSAPLSAFHLQVPNPNNNWLTTVGARLGTDVGGNSGFMGLRLVLANSSSSYDGFVRAARTSGTTFIGMEIGSQSNHGIRFLTNVGAAGSADANERVRIDASGNLGIGAASPQARLDVAGSIRRTGSFYPALWREEVISSDARSGNTVLSQLSQNYVMNAESNNSGSQFRWYNAGGTAIGSVDLTALSPSMALTSGAYLGISTSSPIGQLELVEANSSADRQRLVLTNTQPGGYGSALLWRGQQNFGGGGLRDAAKILVDGSGNWSSEGTSSSRMAIFLGSGGTLNQVMELQPVGNIGIGTSTFSRPGLAVATGEGLSLQRETQGQRKVVSWSRANSIKWDLGMEGDNLTDHFYLIDRPASATRMLVESGTGRVGIGTTNPSALIDVAGSAEFDNALGLRGSSPNIDLEDTDASTRDYRIEVDGSSLTITRYDITSTPDFAITGAGLIGIGTTNPAQKLEVAGTIRATAFEGSGANLTGISAAQLSGSPTFSTVTVTGSAFSVGSSTLVVSAGRVGIGNTAPAVLLHLGTGSPGAAGGIQFGDTATDNIHRDPSYGGAMTDGNFRVGSSSLRIEPNDATLRLYSDISLARNASGLLTMTAPNNFVIPSGNVGIGTTAPGTKLEVRVEDANASDAIDVLKLTHTTAGSAGSGIGAGLVFAAKDDAANVVQSAAIRSINEDAHVGADILGFYTTTSNSTGLYQRLQLKEGPAGSADVRIGISTISPYAYGGDTVITKDYPYGAVLVLQSDYDEASDLDMLAIRNAKAASSSYTFLKAVSDADGTPRTEFVVRGNGNVGIGQDDSGSTTKLWVQGNTSSDYHLRVSSQSGTGGLLVVDKSGGVGVGTTSPLYRAQVLHDDGVASAEHVVMQVGKTSGGAGAINFGYIADGSGVTAAHIKAVAGTRLAIGTNTGSQALNIVDSGAVGVGTTAPGDFAKFEAVTTGTRAAYFAGPSGGHGILVRAGSGDTQNAALIQDASGATTFMAVRADNRVGIGTATPLARLDVDGEARLRNTGAAGGGGTLGFYDLDISGTGRVGYVYTGNNDMTIGMDNGRSIRFEDENATRVFIKNGGNVGIGTVNPQVRLQVAESGGFAGIVSGRTDAYSSGEREVGYLGLWGAKSDGNLDDMTAIVAHQTGSETADLAFWTSATGTGRTRRMTIKSGGNVGIGTTDPGQALTVAGTIESASGGVKFPDGTTQTSAASSLTFSSAVVTGFSLSQTSFGPCVSGSTVTLTGSAFDICYEGAADNASGGGDRYWSFLADGAFAPGLSSSVGVTGQGTSDGRVLNLHGCYHHLSLNSGSHNFCFTIKNNVTGTSSCAAGTRCVFFVRAIK